MLLVLDNFEHLLDGVGIISRLLAAAPRLKVLATSREALNLQEEWLYPLTGMNFPQQGVSKGEDRYDAIQFFTTNAKRVDPTFSVDDSYEAIIRICRLVEGMPLALELASSWIRSLSAAEIANEIENGLDILETRATNVPARHRNMRAALDVSWNRLSESEQDVFKKLSVFRGGFTRDAAEAVANASRNLLAGLADKSWLHRNSAGRYHIHELLRQYGEERLNQNEDETEEAHERHCSYYADFLAPKWEQLSGDRSKQTQDEIEAELENIWTYWEWATIHKQEALIEPTLYSLWLFYDAGNRFREGLQLFTKAAQAFRANETDVLYGKILMYQGSLCYSTDRMIDAEVLLKKSLAILRILGVDKDHAFCLTHLGIVTYHFGGDAARGRDYFNASRAIYQEIGFSNGEYDALLWMGLTYNFEGYIEKAKQFYEASLVIAKTCNNPEGIGSVLAQLADLANDEKSYLAAELYGQEALACFQKGGITWGISIAYGVLAEAACGLGQYHKAEYYILRSLTIEQEYHLIRHIVSTMSLIARLWVAQGKFERAVELVSLGMRCAPTSFPKRELRLLEELIPQLPLDKFEAAFERGKSRDFEMTVQELLTEFATRVETTGSVSHPLTKRELEILHLVARGLSNQAIANELVLALGSVKWYMSEILSKLDVVNRTEAVARARELNLLSN